MNDYHRWALTEVEDDVLAALRYANNAFGNFGQASETFLRKLCRVPVGYTKPARTPEPEPKP